MIAFAHLYIQTKSRRKEQNAKCVQNTERWSFLEKLQILQNKNIKKNVKNDKSK
jgi:hypothetical protein